jgi:hypothetical protein
LIPYALDQGYVVVHPGKPEVLMKDDFVNAEVKVSSLLVRRQVMLGQANNIQPPTDSIKG